MQADRSLHRSRGGLGLGLALVRALVELHEGTVWAHSEGLGQGAEFNVMLPAVAAPEEPAQPPAFSPPAGGPLRLLIVEDHPDAAESLRDLLELAGCTVEIVTSGLEAMTAARRFWPEVVLCDLGLPGMDGYQVAQALRQEPSLAHTRLVAISGYGQPEDQERSLAAGFDLHLTKPIDFAELRRLLEVSPQPQPD